MARSQADEALDLGGLIVGPKVEMQSILGLLGLADGRENETWELSGRRSNLEFLRVVVHDEPAERAKPPASEGNGILSVDDDLFPFEAHDMTIDASRDTIHSVAPPSADWALPATADAPKSGVCHGDFAPWNVVWSGEEPIGILDFDLAHPRCSGGVWMTAGSVSRPGVAQRICGAHVDRHTQCSGSEGRIQVGSGAQSAQRWSHQ